MIDPNNSPADPHFRPVALRWLAAVLAVSAAIAIITWVRWSRPPELPTFKEILQAESAAATSRQAAFTPKIAKSDAQWQAQLTPKQYAVTRHKETEQAFTGEFWNTTEAGTYKCICCGAELFTSKTKYDAGCGWPRFFAAGQPDNLRIETDYSHGMSRVEVTCSQCGAHLGHLFDDGPQPTGQRYCMNSASLAFEKQPASDELPGK